MPVESATSCAQTEPGVPLVLMLPLRQALPIAWLEIGRVTGFELLMRWVRGGKTHTETAI